LTRRGFKPQRDVPTPPRVNLQLAQELAGDTPASPRRVHEHPLHFPDTGLELTNCSAANGLAIGVCDEKHEARICDIFATKSVGRDPWISTAQLIIERQNEANCIA
jgi:hypothetical protein